MKQYIFAVMLLALATPVIAESNSTASTENGTVVQQPASGSSEGCGCSKGKGGGGFFNTIFGSDTYTDDDEYGD